MGKILKDKLALCLVVIVGLNIQIPIGASARYLCSQKGADGQIEEVILATSADRKACEKDVSLSCTCQ